MSLLPDSAKFDLQCQLQACQSRSRRNGKVARLPAALRAQINRMIDDGVSYKDIINSLGPPGQHLNEDNLSNWRLGGYQDYLKTQAINDRARHQTEAAAHVVTETANLNPRRLQAACTQIALLQYFDTLLDHGDRLAREAVTKNPAKFITLINACCNAANTGLALRKHDSPNSPTPSPDDP